MIYRKSNISPGCSLASKEAPMTMMFLAVQTFLVPVKIGMLAFYLRKKTED